MLPETKSDLPKLLCLDQNKWIDLARAHYGKPQGEPFKEALLAVRRAVAEGRLLVPFSSVTITEMACSNDAGRRDRLAQFMISLSGNRSVLSSMSVRPWEVRNSLYAFFGRNHPGFVRRSIVQAGVAHALGIQLQLGELPKSLEDEIHRDLYSDEVAVQFLQSLGNDRVDAAMLRSEEMATLDLQEQVRTRAAAQITTEHRWIYELKEFIENGDVGIAQKSAIDEMGISDETFADAFYTACNSGAEFVRRFEDVHTLKVSIELTIARDRDRVRPIHVNDARDIQWLSIAIPYGNIVVSENYWGHIARARKLDARYGTTLITDLRMLPGELANLGCL